MMLSKTYKTEMLIIKPYRDHHIVLHVLRFDNLELWEKLKECKGIDLFRKYCDVFATPENIKILEDEGYIYEQ